MSHGWIAVDLDGTLAHYDGWQGHDHIGAPIPAMVERVKGWLAAGYEVRIFTARVAIHPNEPPDRIRFYVRWIEDWCEEHVGARLPVTNVKDFGMVELFDDRAVTVEQNTGRLLAPSQPRYTP